MTKISEAAVKAAVDRQMAEMDRKRILLTVLQRRGSLSWSTKFVRWPETPEQVAICALKDIARGGDPESVQKSLEKTLDLFAPSDNDG